MRVPKRSGSVVSSLLNVLGVIFLGGVPVAAMIASGAAFRGELWFAAGLASVSLLLAALCFLPTFIRKRQLHGGR